MESEFQSHDVLSNICSLAYEHNSPESYGAVLNKCLNDYTDFMMSFLSSNKSNILEIYRIIRSNSYTYNKVSICDINLAMTKFSTYYEGLKEYAENISRLDNSVNISRDAISETVSHVAERNERFIASIINGDENPEISVDINTAMANIECVKSLIMLYTNINYESKYIFESLSMKDNSEYIDDISVGIQTYVIAIVKFVYRCMVEILNNYNNIMDSVKTRVMPNKDIKTPKYKIF